MVGDYVLRLLGHMYRQGLTKAVPVIPPALSHLPHLPWTDPEDFNAGYLMRGLSRMPKRLSVPEWQHLQDYLTEKPIFAALDPDDGALHFA